MQDKCSKKHALDRAKERYNINLSNKDIKKISRLIEDGKCNFLRHGGIPKREVYGVSYLNKRFWVVYDHYDKKIVTFLSHQQLCNS